MKAEGTFKIKRILSCCDTELASLEATTHISDGRVCSTSRLFAHLFRRVVAPTQSDHCKRVLNYPESRCVTICFFCFVRGSRRGRMRCRLSEIKGKSPADKSRLSADLVEEEEERDGRWATLFSSTAQNIRRKRRKRCEINPPPASKSDLSLCIFFPY